MAKTWITKSRKMVHVIGPTFIRTNCSDAFKPFMMFAASLSICFMTFHYDIVTSVVRVSRRAHTHTSGQTHLNGFAKGNLILKTFVMGFLPCFRRLHVRGLCPY